MQKRGYHDFSFKVFCLTVPKKFRWGTVRCFRKIRVSQNFMHKNGISLNSVEKFLFHRADKIRRRTLLCFERILVSKIFKQRRGEASRFCRKLFLPHRTEQTAPGDHYVFQKISGREKIFMDKMGGGITIFRRKSFCLTVPKYFIGEYFGVSENFFYRKFSCIGGGYHGFVKIFCLTGLKRKVLSRNPSVFQKIFGIEKNYG